jgi:hypothetical protein
LRIKYINKTAILVRYSPERKMKCMRSEILMAVVQRVLSFGDPLKKFSDILEVCMCKVMIRLSRQPEISDSMIAYSSV